MAKVLVVEDADAVRNAVAAVLTVMGDHDVVHASDGSSGLAALNAYAIDVAVTDIWMPGTDGIAFLREAKSKYPHIPVIVITGGGPNFPPIELSMTVAQSCGADTILIKPFEDDDLLAAVTRLTAPSP